MSEIQKAIQEQIAKRRLNILKGVISVNKVSNDSYEEIQKAAP